MPSSKPTLGVNDLQSQFPVVAAEAYGWDPATVFAQSGKKLEWKCSAGHIYTAVVQSRTGNERGRGRGGCAICAGQMVLPGFNDLKTKFPDIAKEAIGWDPSTVTTGTNQKKDWQCSFGHTYKAQVGDRTKGRGCPICSGRQLLVGYNDLRTKFPQIASDAFGWDPETVTGGTHQKRKWKASCGHEWETSVKSRTSFRDGSFSGTGCPFCSTSGTRLLEGFNDLQTKFPDIASEAYGWDPSTVTSKAGIKRQWRCSLGHIYEALVSNRANGRGCPICVGKKVLIGYNDLLTVCPEIASDAFGWDPTTITAGSNLKKKWKGKCGHIWDAGVHSRVMGNGCPICSKHKLVVGINDLKTTNPEIAEQADEWDPTTVTAGSNLKKKWKCAKNHTWDAVVISRTLIGSGCPSCAEYGFDPSKDAWFYLMERPGEQQLGITNNLPRRMTVHQRNGWVLIEVKGPKNGKLVAKTEKVFKQWLKKEIQVIEGTTENWATTSMEVQSLAELKERSGIETDLF